MVRLLHDCHSSCGAGGLCVLEHVYELVSQEFVHHSDHEPEECER